MATIRNALTFDVEEYFHAEVFAGVAPREQWPTRRVREAMVPLGDQVVVAPDARMDGVVGKLQDGEANRVLVVQDDEVVGIITPTDLTRWLRHWRTLEGRAH